MKTVLLKKNFTKLLSVFLAFALLVVTLVNPSSTVKAEGLDQLDGVEVLVNDENEIRLKTEIDGLVGILVQDQETKEITLTTYEADEINPNPYSINSLTSNDNVDQFALSLDDFTDETGAILTYEDEATGKTATVGSDDSEIRPMVVWLAPLVTIVGAKLIEALLLTAAVIVINEIDFARTDAIATSLRNKSYNHYYARIVQGDVWIGPAITETYAAIRLTSFNGDEDVSGNDVWSKTLSGAAKVAERAGGGKEPVGPEIHGAGLGFGYYYHYHTWNRVGGHSFF